MNQSNIDILETIDKCTGYKLPKVLVELIAEFAVCRKICIHGNECYKCHRIVCKEHICDQSICACHVCNVHGCICTSCPHFC